MNFEKEISEDLGLSFQDEEWIAGQENELDGEDFNFSQSDDSDDYVEQECHASKRRLPDLEYELIDSESELMAVPDDQGEASATIDSDEEEQNNDVYAKSMRSGSIFVHNETERVIMEKGTMFENMTQFRAALKDFAIENGFELLKKKKDGDRVTFKCKSSMCSWGIHASLMPDKITCQVKVIGPAHVCAHVQKNQEANSTWIAQKLLNRIRNDLGIKHEVLYNELLDKYSIEASPMQLFRAKQKAVSWIEGSHHTSNKMLSSYAVEVMTTNPGSLATLESERFASNMSIHTFKRIFISFDACKVGFKRGCKPFIDVDGCHLKGPYGGVLFTAVALDGESGLFPLAYSVVESECKESWAFFLSNLNQVIGFQYNGKLWTFMSDGQKGIDNAIVQIFPGANHKRCARHIYSNFRTKFPGVLLRSLFWRAVKAYTEIKFKQVMESLKVVSNDAYDWMMRKPFEQWARHKFDENVKCDHVTRNMIESFNHWVGQLRFKPILTLLEAIRVKMMAMIHKRLDKTGKWNCNISPSLMNRLEKVKQEARLAKVTYGGGDVYQVMHESKQFIVNMVQKTCCCRVWNMTRIPCRHATVVIQSKRVDIEEHCDWFYSKEAYNRTYSGIIYPLHDESAWSPGQGDELFPPPLRRLPGRPKKKNRRRDASEPPAGTSELRRSNTVTCSNYQAIGHNRRTCQRVPVKTQAGHRRGNGRISRGSGKAKGGSSGRETNEVSSVDNHSQQKNQVGAAGVAIRDRTSGRGSKHAGSIYSMN